MWISDTLIQNNVRKMRASETGDRKKSMRLLLESVADWWRRLFPRDEGLLHRPLTHIRLAALEKGTWRDIVGYMLPHLHGMLRSFIGQMLTWHAVA